MTVSNSFARLRYSANGVTTNFGVIWPFVDQSHVTVMRKPAGSEIEETLTLGVHYTLIPPTGPWPIGALVSIPLGTKNAAGDLFAFLRAEPVKQSADYHDNDAFPAATHEGALDYLTYLAARANERLDRGLLLHPTDPQVLGRFNGMNNRISDVLDPVDDTDVATKAWTLAQISNPVGWAPDKNIAQWNADRLQGRGVANSAPADGNILKWSATNGRWEPAASFDAQSLLGSSNSWTGPNDFSNAVQFENDVFMVGANKSLSFTLTGQRIKGRFYGTPHSSRTLFTANAAAQDCIVGFVPTAGFAFGAGIGVYGAADPDNAPVLFLSAGPLGTLIQASHTGGGATGEISLAVDATLAQKILTNGKILMNRSAVVTGTQVEVAGMVSRTVAAVSVNRNGVAFVVPNTTFTKIDFTVEEADEMGWYDLAADRFQPTVPGWFKFCGAGGPDGVVAAGVRAHVSIFKNGVIYKTLVDLQGGGGTAMSSAGACLVFFNGATDYAELFAWQNSGGNQSWGGGSQDCYLQIAHLG